MVRSAVYVSAALLCVKATLVMMTDLPTRQLHQQGRDDFLKDVPG
jgi:hypothetical protein